MLDRIARDEDLSALLARVAALEATVRLLKEAHDERQDAMDRAVENLAELVRRPS